MNEQNQLVDQQGRPARAAFRDESCPTCKAPKSARVETTPMGQIEPEISCSLCGHHFVGETEA